MMKQRYITLSGTSKSYLCSLCFFVLGLVLLGLFIIFTVLSIFIIQPQTFLAFSIICLGIGGISYFFYYQFAKLAAIAEEIEQGKDNFPPDSSQ